MTTTAPTLPTAGDLLSALSAHGIPAHIDMDAWRWIAVPAPRLAARLPEGATGVELWTFCAATSGPAEDAPLALMDETAAWCLAWTDADGYQRSETVLSWDDLTRADATVPDRAAFLTAYAEAVGTLVMGENFTENAAIATRVMRATFVPSPEPADD